MARRRAFGTVVKRKGRPGYYALWTWKGERYRRSAGRTRKAAEQKLARVEAMLGKGASIDDVLAEVFVEEVGTRLTFKQAGALYLGDSKRRNRPSTYERDVIRLGVIYAAPWTGKQLSPIRSEDIARWIAERQRQGSSVATCNRYMAAISAVFRWATAMGYCDANPVKHLKRFSEKGRERRLFLTAAEARVLVSTTEEPVFAALLTTALRTGMRRKELLDLSWECVDFTRKEITVTSASAKSGEYRTIPMGPTLVETLEVLRKDQKVRKLDGTNPVFAYPDGTCLTKDRVRGAFERLRAVLKDGVDGFPKEKAEQLVFYSLRHTFASIALQSGASIFEVSKILGHSTPTITVSRYGHFCPDAARDAVSRFDRAMDTPASQESAATEGA